MPEANKKIRITFSPDIHWWCNTKAHNHNLHFLNQKIWSFQLEHLDLDLVCNWLSDTKYNFKWKHLQYEEQRYIIINRIKDIQSQIAHVEVVFIRYFSSSQRIFRYLQLPFLFQFAWYTQHAIWPLVLMNLFLEAYATYQHTNHIYLNACSTELYFFFAFFSSLSHKSCSCSYI